MLTAFVSNGRSAALEKEEEDSHADQRHHARESRDGLRDRGGGDQLHHQRHCNAPRYSDEQSDKVYDAVEVQVVMHPAKRFRLLEETSGRLWKSGEHHAQDEHECDEFVFGHSRVLSGHAQFGCDGVADAKSKVGADGRESVGRAAHSKIERLGQDVWDMSLLCDELAVGYFYSDSSRKQNAFSNPLMGSMHIHTIARIYESLRSSQRVDARSDRTCKIPDIVDKTKTILHLIHKDLIQSYLACDGWMRLVEGIDVNPLQATAYKQLRQDVLLSLTTYSSSLKRVDALYRRRAVGICASILQFYHIISSTACEERMLEMTDVAVMVGKALLLPQLDPLEREALCRANEVLTHKSFINSLEMFKMENGPRGRLQLQTRTLRAAFWPAKRCTGEELIESICGMLSECSVSLRSVRLDNLLTASACMQLDDVRSVRTSGQSSLASSACTWKSHVQL